jgi:hypothetical protein
MSFNITLGNNMIIKTEKVDIAELMFDIKKGRTHTLPSGFDLNTRMVKTIEELTEKEIYTPTFKETTH